MFIRVSRPPRLKKKQHLAGVMAKVASGVAASQPGSGQLHECQRREPSKIVVLPSRGDEGAVHRPGICVVFCFFGVFHKGRELGSAGGRLGWDARSETGEESGTPVGGMAGGCCLRGPVRRRASRAMTRSAASSRRLIPTSSARRSCAGSAKSGARFEERRRGRERWPDESSLRKSGCHAVAFGQRLRGSAS